MNMKKEPDVLSGSREFNCTSIVPKKINFTTISVHSFCSSAGVLSRPRDEKKSYLTYTDKSLSTPEKNRVFNDFFSRKLYFETMKLYKTNKRMLQYQHVRGWQKLKFINSNNVILYRALNPRGNSCAGWALAKEMSNSEKARLSSKQNAFEKALCNVDLWEYFATFTLDRTKQDRYDFKKALSHIVQFLQRRHIKYFLVPERHKDGAWHFHALLSAEMQPHLADFSGKALKNPYIKKCISENKPIKHCRAYSESFGYNTIEPCRNKEACTYYMTKYVLKTFDDENFQRVSRRRYFTSKGLKSPFIITPRDLDLAKYEVAHFSRYTEKVYLKLIVPSSFVSTREDFQPHTSPPPV